MLFGGCRSYWEETNMGLNRISLTSLCLFAVLAFSKGSLAKVPHDLVDVADQKHQKVLFVGNSFSFYNNGIHNQVSNLVIGKGLWNAKQNKYRLMSISGGKLSEHGNLLANFLEKGETNWDLVILQEVSNGPLRPEDTSKFRASATKLVKDIKSSGSQAGLFMTWAYLDKPEMTKQLADAYQSLGKELAIPVFPVGIAFANFQKNYPSIPLLIPDVLGVKNGQLAYKKTWKHPSQAGSYLAACVFYSVLYGESAVGNVYKAGLPDDVALKIQNVAWNTVKPSLKK